jgi:uncharacterized protein (TIGR03437 family)
VRLLSAAFLSLAIASFASGQTYTINTVAGGGLPVNLAATSASLGEAPGVAIDAAGNVLVSLTSYNMVVRIDLATGYLTPIAGSGIAGYGGDNGAATSAQLNGPQGIAVDGSGNLYIADTVNGVIRKVSNGTITTFAGGGTLIYPNGVGDGGPATGGYLAGPYGVAVDSAGNVYIADTFNNRVREVSTSGIITTIAGTGYAGSSGDSGPATSAQVNDPEGVAVDSAGNIYIADTYNSRVRQISTGGIITTVAGTGTQGSSGDNGPAASAEVNFPEGVAVDSAGNLYIADNYNSRVRQVSRGVITTLAKLSRPVGMVADSSGHLYVAVTGDELVCEVANGTVTTIAGGGAVGGNGPAVGAQLNSPYGVAVDNSGNLYVADTGDGLLREVSNGAITTIAGNLDPYGVAMDSAGDLYVANGSTVLEVTADGAIATVAGTSGIYGYGGDGGPATSARLNEAFGVAVDSIGNLYIADSFNNRVRKVSGGVITTVAGTGVPGYNGDNIPATGAQLRYPSAVAVDAAGNLFIADSGNQRIREVSDGLIVTVAGSGLGPNVGDNQPATYVSLISASGVAVDNSGSMYITDTAGDRVRRISGGMSDTIAGNGAAAFSGDGGPSAGAQVNGPYGIAVDQSGTVYFADWGNDRIRVLSPSSAPCTYAIGSSSITAVAAADGAYVAVTVQTSAGCGWALQSLPSWITTPGWIVGTGPGTVLLLVAPNPGAARTALLSLAGLPLIVTQQGAGPAPSIIPGGIVNAASYRSTVAPGSIASVFANFLLSSPVVATESPLPTNLSGLSLQIDSGTLAPLYFVSGGQTNFQVPWELTGQTQATLAAILNSQSSAAEMVSLAPFAPAIFAMNSEGTGQGAILDTSYRLADSTNPATAGSSYISIYCTGLGAVTNQPATGSPALGTPLSWTTTIPTVTIGGASADVSFYGLAPGYAGLYQVNAQVPAGSAKGSAVPVTISIGGATSNEVTVAVQ